MYKGITKSGGIRYAVEKKALDNMELVDALAESEESPLAISKVATLLFGAKGKKDIYEQIKKQHDGVVPSEAFTAVIQEIFEAIGEDGKK